MDFQSLRRSRKYKVGVLLVAVLVIVNGAIGRNPAVVVLGLFTFDMTGFQMVDPDPPPLNPSRSQILAYIAERPVRHVVQSGAVVLLLGAGSLYFYRLNDRVDRPGTTVVAVVLGVSALLVLVGTARIWTLAQRQAAARPGPQRE